jgi:hypothetical protein
VTVGLYANSAGEPGALLESWSAPVPAFTGPPAAPPRSARSRIRT